MEEMNNRQPLEETAPAEPAEEILEAAAPVEMQKGILLTPGKLVALIAGVAVLVAVLVGAIVYGMGGFRDDVADSETSEVTEETVPATVPADTGRNDVTYKGTYTVSDEEVKNLADQVVATIGEDVLTVEDLQVHYWMQVQNFMYNYAYYLSYFGLDYSQSLDTQLCTMIDENMTWQQYFLEGALQNWHNFQAMSNVSLKEGYEITGEDKEYLDTLAANLETSAAAQEFANANELLAYNVGPGANVDAYVEYEELYIQGFVYYQDRYDAIDPSVEEMDAYFAEHESAYAENGVTKDGNYIDVRHILVMPEGGVTDENGETVYSEEEWETCRQAAQEILDTWLAGEKTEDSFAQLANTHTADGNDSNQDGVPDGGLYTDVYEGQMVPAFNDWCFDASRQYGDYDLVRTEYGYHVMFFVKSTPIWQVAVKEDMTTELAEKIITDATAAYPMEVDYSAIALGYLDVAQWFEY